MPITRYTKYNPMFHNSIVSNMRDGYKGKLLSASHIGDKYKNSPIDNISDETIFEVWKQYGLYELVIDDIIYEGEDAVFAVLNDMVINPDKASEWLED